MGIIPSRNVHPLESLLCTLRSHSSDVHSTCHGMRDISRLVVATPSYRATLIEILLRKEALGLKLMLKSCRLMRNGDVKAHAVEWSLFAIQENVENTDLLLELDLIAVIADCYSFAAAERVPTWTHIVLARLLCTINNARSDFLPFVFEVGLHRPLINRLRNSFGPNAQDEVSTIVGFLRLVRAPNLVALLAQVRTVEVLLVLLSAPNMEAEIVEGCLKIVIVIVRSVPPTTLPVPVISCLIKMLSSVSAQAQGLTMHIINLLLPHSATATTSPLQDSIIPILGSPLGVGAMSALCVSQCSNTDHFFKIAFYALGRGGVEAFLTDVSHIHHVLVTTLMLPPDVSETTLCFVLGALTHVANHTFGSEALGVIPTTFRFVMTLLYGANTTMQVCMSALRLLRIMCATNVENQHRVLHDKQFLSIVRVLRSRGADEELRCTVVTLEFVDFLVERAGGVFEQCSEATHIAIISTICRVLETAPMPSASLLYVLPTTITLKVLQVLWHVSGYPRLVYNVFRFLPLRKVRQLALCKSVPRVVVLVKTLLRRMREIDPETARDWRSLGVGSDGLPPGSISAIEYAFEEMVSYGCKYVTKVSFETMQHILVMQRAWTANRPSRQRARMRSLVMKLYNEYISLRMEAVELEKSLFDAFLLVQEEHMCLLRVKLNVRRVLTRDMLTEVVDMQDAQYSSIIGFQFHIMILNERIHREQIEGLANICHDGIFDLSACSLKEVTKRKLIFNDKETYFRQIIDIFNGRQAAAARRLQDRDRLEQNHLETRRVVTVEETTATLKLFRGAHQLHVMYNESDPREEIEDDYIDEFDAMLLAFLESVGVMYVKEEGIARRKAIEEYETWVVKTFLVQATVNVTITQQLARKELMEWEQQETDIHTDAFYRSPSLFLEELEGLARAKEERAIQRMWWKAVRFWPVYLIEAHEDLQRFIMLRDENRERRLLKVAELTLRGIMLQVCENNKRLHIYANYTIFSERQRHHLRYVMLVCAHMTSRNAIAMDWLRKSVRIMQPLTIWRLRDIAARCLKRETTTRAAVLVDEKMEFRAVTRECFNLAEGIGRKELQRAWHHGAFNHKHHIENLFHERLLKTVSLQQTTTESVIVDSSMKSSHLMNESAATKLVKRRPQSAGSNPNHSLNATNGGRDKGDRSPPEKMVRRVKVWMDMYVV